MNPPMIVSPSPATFPRFVLPNGLALAMNVSLETAEAEWLDYGGPGESAEVQTAYRKRFEWLRDHAPGGVKIAAPVVIERIPAIATPGNEDLSSSGVESRHAGVIPRGATVPVVTGGPRLMATDSKVGSNPTSHSPSSAGPARQSSPHQSAKPAKKSYPVDRDLGARIRHAISEAGWGKKLCAEVAKALDIGEPTLRNARSGICISGRTKERLCALLKLNPAWLDTGTGPMFADGAEAKNPTPVLAAPSEKKLTDPKGVGRRLREARIAAGWSSSSHADGMVISFAAAAGVSRSMVGKAEQGESSQPYRQQVCEFLKINAVWLFTGKGPMFLGEPPRPSQPAKPAAAKISAEKSAVAPPAKTGTESGPGDRAQTAEISAPPEKAAPMPQDATHTGARPEHVPAPLASGGNNGALSQHDGECIELGRIVREFTESRREFKQAETRFADAKIALKTLIGDGVFLIV